MAGTITTAGGKARFVAADLTDPAQLDCLVEQAGPVPQNSSGRPEQGRCGLGARMPFIVVSPWARANYVDGGLLDQSSVVKFIEDNWSLPAMGNGAADAQAGSMRLMFDFRAPDQPPLFLDPATGAVRGK